MTTRTYTIREQCMARCDRHAMHPCPPTRIAEFPLLSLSSQGAILRRFSASARLIPPRRCMNRHSYCNVVFTCCVGASDSKCSIVLLFVWSFVSQMRAIWTKQSLFRNSCAT
ncbi:uncharacterized protein M421DRAFT_137463 [Didymella exigua CBS 183.55]|uniref:Uncharacterized protein n=1 Tax=Didymella exigua CBS 183.55 TaxID=1150837 RepID=A0A6A5RVL7_9PLEO|nr:uncharacterized protein M421DRAFT_137463 [Didymella exigua CBS 183.55]KAF1929357.1 hypothetical protein M421DRAFT_137463 [Didymella exigua CBS 183.55]